MSECICSLVELCGCSYSSGVYTGTADGTIRAAELLPLLLTSPRHQKPGEPREGTTTDGLALHIVRRGVWFLWAWPDSLTVAPCCRWQTGPPPHQWPVTDFTVDFSPVSALGHHELSSCFLVRKGRGRPQGPPAWVLADTLSMLMRGLSAVAKKARQKKEPVSTRTLQRAS